MPERFLRIFVVDTMRGMNTLPFRRPNGFRRSESCHLCDTHGFPDSDNACGSVGSDGRWLDIEEQ